MPGAGNDIKNLSGPYSQRLITTSDSLNIKDNNGTERVTACLMFGGTGDVAVLLEGDTAPVTWPAPAVGVWHPCRAKRVYTSNTAAGITSIIAGWND